MSYFEKVAFRPEFQIDKQAFQYSGCRGVYQKELGGDDRG